MHGLANRKSRAEVTERISLRTANAYSKSYSSRPSHKRLSRPPRLSEQGGAVTLDGQQGC